MAKIKVRLVNSKIIRGNDHKRIIAKRMKCTKTAKQALLFSLVTTCIAMGMMIYILIVEV